MENNKISLQRIFKASPEKVFKAFSNSDGMAAWLPPNGFVCQVHSMDFKIGGCFKMSFINFGTESSHSFGGEYLEIISNEKLVYTDVFDDPNLPGKITTTVEIRAVLCGTELIVTQEGIPAAIPTEMCYLGWQESLEKLKNLVEPNIPDA